MAWQNVPAVFELGGTQKGLFGGGHLQTGCDIRKQHLGVLPMAQNDLWTILHWILSEADIDHGECPALLHTTG